MSRLIFFRGAGGPDLRHLLNIYSPGSQDVSSKELWPMSSSEKTYLCGAPYYGFYVQFLKQLTLGPQRGFKALDPAADP